jgi:hypothetical protein
MLVNKLFRQKQRLDAPGYRDLCKTPPFGQSLRLPRSSGRWYWGQAQISILEIFYIFLPAPWNAKIPLGGVEIFAFLDLDQS